MAAWPRWVADYVDAARRLFRRRRRHGPVAPRPGLEALSSRIVFSVGWQLYPHVPAYEPADPAVTAPTPLDPRTSYADNAAPLWQDAAAYHYADHNGPADHDVTAADLYYLLLAEDHGAGSRHGVLPEVAAADPTAAPTADDRAVSAAQPDAAPSPPPARVDGGGIADDLAAADAATPSDGTGDVDAADPGGPAANLLVVNWASPNPTEQLTPLTRANLALVPTYAVNDAPPPAAPPARPNGEVDLALAGVVVGPDHARTAAPVADPSAAREKAVDYVFQTSAAVGDAAAPSAGGLSWVADAVGRLFAELPRLGGSNRTAAAVVLVEAVVVLGAWRLTEPEGRGRE